MFTAVPLLCWVLHFSIFLTPLLHFFLKAKPIIIFFVKVLVELFSGILFSFGDISEIMLYT